MACSHDATCGKGICGKQNVASSELVCCKYKKCLATNSRYTVRHKQNGAHCWLDEERCGATVLQLYEFASEFCVPQVAYRVNRPGLATFFFTQIPLPQVASCEQAIRSIKRHIVTNAE